MMDFSEVIKNLSRFNRYRRDSWDESRVSIWLVPTGSYSTTKGIVQCGAYIALDTKDGETTIWEPTQADILAKDWSKVEY